MYRLSSLLLTLFLLPSLLNAQTFKESWKFNTGSNIIAGPVIHENNLYLGNEEGEFFSIDITSGEEVWKIETGGNIQSRATIIENQIFFESANIFYLVKMESGEVIWKFDPGFEPHSFTYDDREYLYKIDPWDDKRSEAFKYNDVIYVGSGNGHVYGFDQKSGEVVFQTGTINNSPVRSSPLVFEGNLYFGDWNGRVYKYNFKDFDFKWIKKTYRGDRPYPSFGGVVSKFKVHNNRLYFGARNHMLNVLLDETGEREWTYADPKGGWIITDPVIENDTLFIGGSDNYTMFAFSTRDGRLLWDQNGGKNIYTEALLMDDFLIYTAGNGYDLNDTGKVFLLNKKDGSVFDEFETPKAVFSSPVSKDKSIYFGSFDGYIYSLDIVR